MKAQTNDATAYHIDLVCILSNGRLKQSLGATVQKDTWARNMKKYLLPLYLLSQCCTICDNTNL